MNKFKTHPENKFTSDFTENDFNQTIKEFFVGIVIITTAIFSIFLIILIK